MTCNRTNGIKYVIFDFGGVYAREGLEIARRVYGKKIGVDIENAWHTRIKPIWNSFEKGEIAEEDFWKGLEHVLGCDKFDSAEFKGLFYKNQQKNEGLAAAISKLREKGYKTALLTNNAREWIEDWDRQDNLGRYFDVIVSSHEVKRVKPDPEIYNIMLQRLGAKPEECLFIDDKERNLVTARNLGMKTILFDETDRAINSLQEILGQELI
jgi:putative hydrolase of the HAD superfamily